MGQCEVPPLINKEFIVYCLLQQSHQPFVAHSTCGNICYETRTLKKTIHYVSYFFQQYLQVSFLQSQYWLEIDIFGDNTKVDFLSTRDETFKSNSIDQFQFYVCLFAFHCCILGKKHKSTVSSLYVIQSPSNQTDIFSLHTKLKFLK